MEPLANLRLVHYTAVILFIVVSTAEAGNSKENETNSTCLCDPIQKDFDTLYKNNTVKKGCRRCYVFTYDFTLDQVSKCIHTFRYLIRYLHCTRYQACCKTCFTVSKEQIISVGLKFFIWSHRAKMITYVLFYSFMLKKLL